MKYSFIMCAYKDYASLNKCLSLINTRESKDYEVLVWDNTPTEERLSGYLGDGVGIGFASGCNKAVEQAEGEILVFLNPDTEPTGDWLDRMCKGFDEGYDAIGSTSDYIAGIQSWKLWQDYPKPFADTKLIIPVCMVIKAETYREIPFDNSFFLGCEDLDWSWRMNLAGKRMGIAADVFVHHVGHTGFNLTPGKDAIIKAGEKRIREKLKAYYGESVPSSVDIWGCKILATELKPQRLSVCMITRGDCIVNERYSFADEVIVHKCPDLQDFAAARNEALAKCTGDWVLWLDDDDMVSRETADLIDALIHKPGNRVALQACHFAFKVENTDKEGSPNSIFYQPRLFPRLEGIKWGGIGGCRGYVHESILKSCEDSGLPMVTVPNIVIQHTGYSDPEVMVKKAERNLRLLNREPDCAFKFYNLGTTYFGQDNEKAAGAFKRALDLSEGEGVSFIDGCRYFLALSLGRLKQDVPLSLLENNSKPDAKHLLGQLLIEMGDVERGCDLLWEYLKLGEVTDFLGSNCHTFRKQAVKTLTEIGVLAI